MNKKHFYAAVILLLFLAVGIQPTFATTWIIGPDQVPPVIPPVTIGTWNEETRTFTLVDNTPLGDNIEIIDDNLTLDGAGYEVAPSSSDPGVDLYGRLYVTIKNLNVTGGGSGISLRIASYCIVTDNTVSTCHYGIWLAGSRNNTVTYNTVESSIESGICLQQGYWGGSEYGSDDNMLTGNTTKNSQNGFGIYIQYSKNNTLTYNNASNNGYGIKILSSAGGNILENNTVNDNTYYGIELNVSKDYTLTGNTVSVNLIGIYLYGCNDPDSFGTLTNNIVTNNSTGIQLRRSSYNTVTGNTVSSNNWGIRIRALSGEKSINNQVYNNNFENIPGQQAEVYDAEGSGDITGNVFNLALPTGGNYWSDYTGIDRGDGIGEPEYTFIGGKDNLPWFAENGWDFYTPSTPEDAILQLIADVKDLNGQQGIINSLDAKLQNALDALEAKNAGQRQDAVNKMQAFINAVEAQRGNKITDAQANALVAKANYIISLL